MKKKYFNLFLISIVFLFIYFIFTNKVLVTNSIINSSSLFFYKVFPSLFPMFIISSILINLNTPYYLSKIIKSKRVSSLSIYTLILCFISGTPSSAFIVKELEEQKIVNNKEASLLLTFTFFTNPFFLLNMLSLIFPSDIVIKLMIAHYLPNLIIMFFTPIGNKELTSKKITNYSSIIPNAISKSLNTLLTILGTIVFFNLLILLIPKKYIFLSGFLEITNGLNILPTLNIALNIKAYLALMYLSWGGLSIIMQIKSILNDTNISITNFLKARLIHLILSILILSLTGL